MNTIAALYVERDGVYSNMHGVDVWDEARDARKYDGPHAVVCHSPCERFGRYWGGGPSAKVKRIMGDDGGCFAHALRCVRTYGGVLEHPEASHAWVMFGLTKPPKAGGWIKADELGGMTCCVYQRHYGHRAAKATWLYACKTDTPELIWGPARGERLDEGFHSSAERRAARAAGIPPLKRMPKTERAATPIAFRNLLISISRSAYKHRQQPTCSLGAQQSELT